MEAVGNTASKRFLTFRVDAQRYALPTDEVSEVIRLPEVARVPQGPTALRGLANLRGTVIPLADLRAMLGKKAATDESMARALVLDIGAPVAVVVDLVDSLETTSAEQLETRPQELGVVGSERLLGAFAAAPGNPVTKILDIRAMLAAAFTNLARATRIERELTAHHVAQPTADAVLEPQMLVTFDVAGQEFGLPLDVVEEILPLPATIAAVARPEAAVLGLTAVRDVLMPLFSLHGLLGFDTEPVVSERTKVVVLTVGGALIGLVADNARSVLAADPRLMEAVPAALAIRTGGESRIQSVYRGDSGKRLISVLSPEKLFREDLMQRLTAIPPGQNRQSLAAPSAPIAAAAERSFLVFRLGQDEFGLPIDSVVEVAQVPAQITRVPKTPKFLEGIVNLRGAVIPVIDQRRRFDMPPHDPRVTRRLVVISTDRHRAGIIVDDVADVLGVPADAIASPPDLTAHMSRLVNGVIILSDARRMVLTLDPAELLTQAEHGLLDAFHASSKKAHA